jgi:hypothetical protein
MVKTAKSFHISPRQVEVVSEIGVAWRGLRGEKSQEHKK